VRILASTVIASTGGMLFWLLAARMATRAEVGSAAAVLSSVNFVNYVTSLGLPVAVARYGGSSTRDSRLLFN
jgi:O-antigen/teichoic acid export membrane protein